MADPYKKDFIQNDISLGPLMRLPVESRAGVCNAGHGRSSSQ